MTQCLFIFLLSSLILTLCALVTRLATRARKPRFIGHLAGVGAWSIAQLPLGLLMMGPDRWLARPDDNPYWPDNPPFLFELFCRFCHDVLATITFPSIWLNGLGEHLFGFDLFWFAPVADLLFWGCVCHLIAYAMFRRKPPPRASVAVAWWLRPLTDHAQPLANSQAV
jgi:hypothetical protein